MSFTPMFSIKDLMQGVVKEVDKIERLVEATLNRVGLQFVIEARDRASKGFNFFGADYQDRTGNLRSSIGYLIVKNGKIISDNFGVADKGTDKETGRKKAYEFALENIESTVGYVLICVAGMEYAAAVEAMGYDVITSSAFKAENTLIKEWDQLKKLAA